jgi:Zn-dependent protease
MNTKLELGRIGGVTIVLDMFFVLILAIFTYPYFTSGNSQLMSAGLLIIAGIIGSILLHELGHAAGAWAFKTKVAQIELTGLGGLIQFGSSLPKSALARAVIYLAGPAANIALWFVFTQLWSFAAAGNKPMLALALRQLASINLVLAIFNMLPAFPLDGGHTLDALLGKVTGGIWAQRVVAVLGLIVAGLVGLYAVQSLPNGLFMLFIAFVLLEQNWSALQQVGGFNWRK